MRGTIVKLSSILINLSRFFQINQIATAASFKGIVSLDFQALFSVIQHLPLDH
jgi:hypothetical protein